MLMNARDRHEIVPIKTAGEVFFGKEMRPEPVPVGLDTIENLTDLHGGKRRIADAMAHCEELLLDKSCLTKTTVGFGPNLQIRTTMVHKTARMRGKHVQERGKHTPELPIVESIMLENRCQLMCLIGRPSETAVADLVLQKRTPASMTVCGE